MTNSENSGAKRGATKSYSGQSISAGDMLLETVARLLSPRATEGKTPRRILVALSGGADSVALLHTLRRMQEVWDDLEIKGVHCNFNLRGEESRGDEIFCRDLCRDLGIEIETVSFDTDAYRRRERLSVEEACRNLRYDFFRKTMEREGWERTAVAHHADDNAETFLLNLMRGAGLNGLKGMESDNGIIMRPFLNIERVRILEALEEWGADYRTDSSNLSSDYRRNFLRNELLPLLESRFPEARRSICRSISNLRSENNLLLEMAERNLSFRPGERRLARRAVLETGEKVTLLVRFLSPFGGSPEIATEIARSVSTGAWSRCLWRLNNEWRVSLERDFIEILPTIIPPLVVKEERLEMSEELMGHIVSNSDPKVAYFPRPLSSYNLRPPINGERMRGFGGGERKLVSRHIKNKRLSLAEKEALLLLCDKDTDEALWIPGVKRGEGERVSPDCKEVWRFKAESLSV